MCEWCRSQSGTISPSGWPPGEASRANLVCENPSPKSEGGGDRLIKLVFTLRRREGMTREEFQRYWREQHAPLVARHARALRIRRYIQVHARETDLDAAISAS